MYLFFQWFGTVELRPLTSGLQDPHFVRIEQLRGHISDQLRSGRGSQREQEIRKRQCQPLGAERNVKAHLIWLAL